MRKRAVAVLVLAAATLLVGCGGGDDGSSAGGGGAGALAAGLSAESLGAGAVASAAGITVVGSGSVQAAPDVAEWSFGVQTSGDTADAALSANSEAIAQVTAALRDAGVAGDDLRTEQVSVYPRTGDDGLSVTGYDASNTVGATIRDLDAAGAIVDAAVRAGANQVYGPTLTVSDAKTQYGAAVEAAFDDARERAEAIAAKAGVTLGAPVAIVEGGGGGDVPVYDRAAMEGAMEGAAVPIEPGVQDVGATLSVTFAIE